MPGIGEWQGTRSRGFAGAADAHQAPPPLAAVREERAADPDQHLELVQELAGRLALLLSGPRPADRAGTGGCCPPRSRHLNETYHLTQLHDAGSVFDWEQGLDLIQLVANRAQRTLGASAPETRRLLQAIDTHCIVLRQKALEQESDSSLEWLETLHEAATSMASLATAAAAVRSRPNLTGLITHAGLDC